ncbi:MAG: ROK family protein, partial [Candidatus Izemoplasmatales bacterium]
MRKYNLGIDIGGTSIKIGLFDIDGNLLEVFTLKTNLRDHGRYILFEIASLIKKKVDFQEIKAIGFGVPGPVANNIVYSCVNLGWGR